MSSTPGASPIARPKASFCWLPPLSSSAGEESRARSSPTAAASLAAAARVLARENAEPAVKGDPHGNQIESNTEPEEHAFAGAILRDEAELAGLRLRYRAQAQRLPGDAHLTGRVEREPRQRAHDLDGAGPDLPGKTDHRATLAR